MAGQAFRRAHAWWLPCPRKPISGKHVARPVDGLVCGSGPGIRLRLLSGPCLNARARWRLDDWIGRIAAGGEVRMGRHVGLWLEV